MSQTSKKNDSKSVALIDIEPGDRSDGTPVESDQGRVEAGAADFDEAHSPAAAAKPDHQKKPREVNGPRGLEPTRYGDWESKGRCHDF
ncbi:MAG: DUF1674 domain-containing protein [Gammaproteobacteria bacterium]|nr:DUF1674 domain-containing protein [Gammaproteobacteria bacterium]